MSPIPLYLPHIGLVLPYMIEILSMPLKCEIGACGVFLWVF